MLSGPARPEWSTGVEAGVAHESNVGRGKLAQDIRSDTALTAAATVRGYYIPGERGVFSLGLEALGASHLHLQGLNHADLGISLGYKHKLDLGLEAPWLAARASLTRLNYKDSLRNGWLQAAALSAGRRIGERWDVRAEIGYERRSSDDDEEVVPGISGEAFAQRNRTLSANVDYAMSSDTTLSLGYTHRKGDVTPTTQRNFEIFVVSTAIAADPTFGPDWFAYRLPATTHLFFVGLSRALGERSSLNLGIERQVSYGTGGNDYYNTHSRLSVAHQF